MKERGFLIMFTGFPEETIRFFLDLRFHNDISFFKQHEDVYHQYVKEPFFSFIEAMEPTMQQIANDMDLRPGKCLARIRRDTRFTKDKTPFRDHMWLLFRRAGESRDSSVMYWFELSPETVDWGVGFWGANRPAMDALRNKMIRRPAEVLDVLKKCKLPDAHLQIYGDAYKRMKVPDTLPQALQPLYPQKEIYIKRSGTPLRTAYGKELIDLVSADFLRLKPMYTLLRTAADEGLAALDS